MKQFNLSKQNEFVLKSIAKDLPKLPLKSYNPTKGIKWKWLRNAWQWISNRKWPNGEDVIKLKTVVFINKKLFGLNDHDWNHERRLRKAYLKYGIEGVVKYLKNMGVNESYIKEWLNDFKLSNEDIAYLRSIEKKHGIKLIK